MIRSGGQFGSAAAVGAAQANAATTIATSANTRDGRTDTDECVDGGCLVFEVSSRTDCEASGHSGVSVRSMSPLRRKKEGPRLGRPIGRVGSRIVRLRAIAPIECDDR